MDPLEYGKTIYDGRVEQHRERIFTKDEIKVENLVFGEDDSIMTNGATEAIFIKQEQPNIVIKSDSEIYDGSSYEQNEHLHYVKKEEIAIDESYAMKNEAVEGKF